MRPKGLVRVEMVTRQEVDAGIVCHAPPDLLPRRLDDESSCPLIDGTGAEFLCATLRTIAKEHRSHVLEIGMVATHIHLLVRSEPLADVVKMITRMKGVTSRVAKRDSICPITWADGYDIESVSPADELKIRHYLRAQPYRHPTEAIADWAGDERAHGTTW